MSLLKLPCSYAHRQGIVGIVCEDSLPLSSQSIHSNLTRSTRNSLDHLVDFTIVKFNFYSLRFTWQTLGRCCANKSDQNFHNLYTLLGLVILGLLVFSFMPKLMYEKMVSPYFPRCAHGIISTTLVVSKIYYF